MNKYQKAKSRRIKRIVRFGNANGAIYTYKQVRSIIRRFDRAIASVARSFRSLKVPISKEIKRILADKESECCGYKATTTIVDETIPREEG